MRARIGDLAIARFDPDDEDRACGKKYHELVGIVTKCRPLVENHPHHHTNFGYEFIYWYNAGGKIEIYTTTLTPSRLVRARPKNDDWEGTLLSLTRDKVKPVVE